MMRAVGRIGVAELGGAAVVFGSIIIINRSGYALGSGLSRALEPLLVPELRLQLDEHFYGVYAQMQGLLLLAGISLSVGMLLDETLLFGRSGDPCELCWGEYCRMNCKGSPPAIAIRASVTVLREPRATVPDVCRTSVMAALFPFLRWAAERRGLCDVVPLVYTCVSILLEVGLCGNLILSVLYRPTWGDCSTAALLQLWGLLLRLTVPSLVMILTAFETYSVLSGDGTPIQLAAYPVGNQVSSEWSIVSRVWVNTTIFIGNAMDSGQLLLIIDYAIATTVFAVGAALLNALVVCTFRATIVGFVIPDTAVVEQLTHITPHHLFIIWWTRHGAIL